MPPGSSALCRRWLILALLGMAACAGPPAPLRSSGRGTPPVTFPAAAVAAGMATSMIGAPYRYGGASPTGFDCSGLILYSYKKAGISGLPHSAARLERITEPVPLSKVQPGDLLFFRLSGVKTSHVAMVVGRRAFVHAPSKGKTVERVSFDHVYWGPRIRRAGRFATPAL